MATQHTPQGNKAAGQQATPGDFQNPPPVVAMAAPPPAMLMSDDQFQVLIDRCGTGHGPGAPVAEQDFPNVSSVAVKLPTFWTHDPDLWFLQTEAVFASWSPAVTRDGTKFNHVVTALPSDALNACKNIIRLPVTNANRYELLRTTLITTYGQTAAQKHSELIDFAANKEPITDQKPSSILLYIQELSGDSKEAFERHVLLNRLPSPSPTLHSLWRPTR